MKKVNNFQIANVQPQGVARSSCHILIDSNHRGKMGIRANVHLSKIMRTPMKVDVRSYVCDVRQWSKSVNISYLFLLLL